MSVDQNLISTIGKGVLVLAGISDKDTRKEVESMASKVLKMKMWPDENGVNVPQMNFFPSLSVSLPY